jgi:hypothetical protein
LLAWIVSCFRGTMTTWLGIGFATIEAPQKFDPATN